MPPSTLTTRCVHCHTVFRVTTVQLQAHGGQVRCGRCMQVFDALAALAPEPAVIEPQSPPAFDPVVGQESAPPLPQIDVLPDVLPEAEIIAADLSDQAEPVSADTPFSDPSPAIAQEDGVPVEEAPARHALVEELPGETTQTVADSPLVDTSASDVVPDADNPFTQAMAEEPASDPRRRGLPAAIAVMLVALVLQGLFFYRSEVAAQHPLAKQWLSWICVQAGCSVVLPQRPQLILIEASDLQVIDPANPNRIQLTATLRNHAGYEVGYPALDLVLTNVNDHTLARRIFLPGDYLAAGRDAGSGIAANAELTVRLGLETGNLGAAGFRLAVLAAPGG
ncbi:MAG: hypothetical protein RJA24_111 [Pseudomonadota bacterium]